MGNLFGVRRKAPQVTPQDRAVLQLKQQRDKIRIYQKRTEQELIKSKELALKLFQNNLKERALIVMKRRKCMEDIIHRTDKQLETLQQLASEIEFTQAEVSVVQGLKIGNEALKQLTSLMNIEDIQQMMEDNQEAAEKQREISDILSKSSERFDDSELLQELDELREKEAPQVVDRNKNALVAAEDEDQTETNEAEENKRDEILDAMIEEIPSVPETKPVLEGDQSAADTRSPDKKSATPVKESVKKEAENLLVPA